MIRILAPLAAVASYCVTMLWSDSCVIGLPPATCDETTSWCRQNNIKLMPWIIILIGCIHQLLVSNNNNNNNDLLQVQGQLSAWHCNCISAHIWRQQYYRPTTLYSSATLTYSQLCLPAVFAANWIHLVLNRRKHLPDRAYICHGSDRPRMDWSMES